MANIGSLFPSKYLKAADFPEPQTLTMDKLSIEEVGQEKESRPVLWFTEVDKGLVLNKTNANMIAHTFGDETDEWKGKQVTLRKEPVSFQGKVVDSIRVKAA